MANKIDADILTAALEDLSRRVKHGDRQAIMLQAFIDALLDQVEQARPTDPTIAGWHPAIAGEVAFCPN